ncbi:MAG: HD domain-containing protein [Planctomycetota bacterium]|jgi:poly(A) polymerase|nr:HD domain-containing protein [Planctomycetota bacterium]
MIAKTMTLEPPAGALAIAARLRDAGHVAYFCGGAVRDALMGVRPKDYDLATSAAPDEVERLFERTVPVGKAFGVMLVGGDGDVFYEVATFRTDRDYADGRRPDGVDFSSPEEDAKRRDFTINALFYDPVRKEAVDYVGGLDDIAMRRLRAVGDPRARFSEDKLRLLRAVRFAARTGFAIEPATWNALVEMGGESTCVSPERIAAEFEGMLTGGRSRAAFDLLKQSGMLRHILPEVDALAGVEQPPDFHPEGDVWEHTLLLLDEMDQVRTGRPAAPDPSAFGDVDASRGMTTGDFSADEHVRGVLESRERMDEHLRISLAWAALLHDIGKPPTFSVSDRIRFNNHDKEGALMATEALRRLRRPRRLIETVSDLIARHMHFANLRKMRNSKLRRWLADPGFPAHLELHRLDCMASHRMLANWQFGLEAWRKELATPPPHEPIIGGRDLIALGMTPGPETGRLLARIEDARLEGEISDREEALATARAYISQLSPKS